jgi:hypothetical protein
LTEPLSFVNRPRGAKKSSFNRTIPPKLKIESMFIAVQLTMVKIQSQPRCPSADEWIKKMWYIYIKEYY